MKILLSGCSGAMGKVITEICKETDGYHIVAGYARMEIEGLDYPVYNNLSNVKEDVDVIIDFSNVEALPSVLNYGVEKNIPMVIASSGFGEAEYNEIEKASEKVAIVHSRNMSLGVNILLDIVKKAAASLIGFDVEIVEKHHKYKVDAPSGTAYMLMDAVKSGRKDLNETVYGRQGNDAKRQDGELGVHAIRGGTIVGEHSVIFAGLDEVVEIKHTAMSKAIFANGAIKAADFIVGKTKGLYSMEDVI